MIELIFSRAKIAEIGLLKFMCLLIFRYVPGYLLQPFPALVINRFFKGQVKDDRDKP